MAYINISRTNVSFVQHPTMGGFTLITYTVTGNAGEPTLTFEQRINRSTPFTEAESQNESDAILALANGNRQSAQLPLGPVTPVPFTPDAETSMVDLFRDRYLRLVAGRRAQETGLQVIPTPSTELDTLQSQCATTWQNATAPQRQRLLRAMVVIGS